MFTDPLTVLRQIGWCQGANQRKGTGEVCLNGAINIADGLSAWNWEGGKLTPTAKRFADAVRVVICEQYPDRAGWGTISLFNDHPDTTIDDVAAVCEKAHLLASELPVA